MACKSSRVVYNVFKQYYDRCRLTCNDRGQTNEPILYDIQFKVTKLKNEKKIINYELFPIIPSQKYIFF